MTERAVVNGRVESSNLSSSADEFLNTRQIKAQKLVIARHEAILLNVSRFQLPGDCFAKLRKARNDGRWFNNEVE